MAREESGKACAGWPVKRRDLGGELEPLRGAWDNYSLSRGNQCKLVMYIVYLVVS